MTKKMLIDALHPEEIRVAVTLDDRLEAFEFETATKKQNKGNIYLAKVTRVEPSLQAVFVEYGGVRQGFLPFSEIHFDYYQIPVADKQRLQKEAEDAIAKQRGSDDDADDLEDGEAEEVGGDADERAAEAPSVSQNFYRKYKIQEVIKRGQIILIQVIKDERGSKGASLTTYVSIPGRYCVLMPKNDKQGGVSRKIRDFDARKKLRKTVKELETPKGMSVIIRTAGSDRTKAEIKRDFNYLLKLWEKIRDLAVKSNAPALIYEESDIIKRAIRDVYDNDTEEIIIEGENSYNDAKDFMKLITPSHAKKVKQYKENTPIFWKYEVEDELNMVYDTEVPLKSGGYLVINPTEALVAIDVNSGKSTRERNVEQTALKTNIEAAREVARQLRLRDLAGLVVIDFIDMLELRNKKSVERKLKEALQKDRAKIQVGRISNFGLLEMSRQRLGSSFVEASTVGCPRCNGLGRVRSKDSSAVMIMRAAEYEARQENAPKTLEIFTSEELGPYIEESMKDDIERIKEATKCGIKIVTDKRLIGAQFTIGMKELEAFLAEAKKAQEELERGLVPRASGGKRAQRSSSPIQQGDLDEDDLAFLDVEDDDEDENDAPSKHRPPRHKHNNAHGGGGKRDSGGGGKRDSREQGNNRKRSRGGKNRRVAGQQKHGNKEVDGNRIATERADARGNVASKKPPAGTVAASPKGEEGGDSSVLKNLWKRITE